MAPVISLNRVKLLEAQPPHPRLLPVERTPPKGREMRLCRAPSRIGGTERDVLEGLPVPMRRAPRARKLRLFRSFKLFNDLKTETRHVLTRPLGDRLRRIGWMRRL